METMQAAAMGIDGPDSLESRAVNGDKAAFAALVNNAETLLFAVSSSYLSNPEDRADAVQEALLRAWNKRSTLRTPRYFKTWLVKILINECKRQYRKKKTLPLYDEILAADEKGGSIDIKKAVASLDEKTRLVTVLYYIEGYNIQETAGLLGIPEGTVKSRLHKAREFLKEELKDYDE